MHVTECYAGGVESAINSYASNTPEFTHLLLRNSRRANVGSSEPPAGIFKEVLGLPENHFAAVRTVFLLSKTTGADVIHAHSSFAGVYTRILKFIGFKSQDLPVVYTPHGLSFTRLDISSSKRELFERMERLLAPHTAVFAGCATWETELLRQLSPHVLNITVPNSLNSEVERSLRTWSKPVSPTIGIVGRITPARSPVKFAEIARCLKEINGDFRALWIGDGDADSRRFLEAHDIEVTGWLSGNELRETTSRLSVLVHTAQWDGFPMSVLEAASSGVPVLVSDIPALAADCDPLVRFSSIDEAVARVIRAVENPEENIKSWGKVLNIYSRANQTDRLKEVYTTAQMRSL